MRLGGFRVHTVNRHKTPRAGGENDNAVHLSAQGDAIAGAAHGPAPLEAVARKDRDVHEQIQRARRYGGADAERGKCGVPVLGAIVVMAGVTKIVATLRVARGD
jgi:hypothetical protein